jgi:integrase
MSQNQYLQQRHRTWYVVVEVPKRLRAAVGRARLFRSLKTQSLQEANRLKHPVVTEFKRRLHIIANAPNQVEAKVMAKALTYRRDYLAASAKEVEVHDSTDPERVEIVSARGFVVGDIRDHWEALKRKGEHGLADRFMQIATAETTPLAELPEQWLGEIEGEIAEQTRSQHRTTLKAFLTWAGEHVGVEEITRRKAGEYLSEGLLPSGNARKTIKRKLSSLSSFWRWLKSRGFAEDNPWRGQDLGTKKGTQARKGFSDPELEQLLSGTYTDHYHSILQDLIRLALVTGARLNELCALQRGDAESRDDGWWITVREGKTEAAKRSIPIHSSAVGVLQRRKDARTPYLFDDLEAGGPDGKRSWYVSKAFRRYRARVGIVGWLRDFHALRVTFTEVMEGAEVPESTVALLVGHARESMTYGHYSKGKRVQLRTAIDKLAYGGNVMSLIGAQPTGQRPRLTTRKTRRASLA